MVDKGHHLTIENFDPTSKREPVINSPRSLEACARQGIKPFELVMKNIEEIKAMYADKKLDKHGYDLMAKHYEERRREKVRVCIEERQQVMDEERHGPINYTYETLGIMHSVGVSGSPGKSKMRSTMTNVDSTMIEKEKRAIEKMKIKQEQEIKTMLDYEQKMTDIRLKQEEKLRIQKEKERMREAENARKRKEAEEKKAQRDREKAQREAEEQERLRKIADDAYRKEQEKIALQKEQERQRKIEIRRKEEEQKRKQEEFKQETEKKLREQAMRVQERKLQMDAQDKARQEYLRRQQMIKQQEHEEKQKLKAEKIQAARDQNEKIMYDKRTEFDRRQAEGDERRKMFEMEKEQKAQENRQRAKEKAEEIQKVLVENENLEKKRKEDFFIKKAMADERKRELDAIADQQRRAKAEANREKDEFRKQVKVNNEELLKTRTNTFLFKQREQEVKLEQSQKKRQDDLQNKKNLDTIKRNDRLETVQRISMMNEYAKAKTLEKIQADKEKAQKIKQDRSELLEMRMQIRRDMDKSKRELVDKFDKAKRGKADIQSMKTTSYNQSVQQISMPQEDLQKSQPISRAASTTGMSQIKKKKQTPQTTTRTGESQLGERTKVTEKDARKVIDQTKMKQNHDMLLMLEEEQVRENNRETKLSSIKDPAEKKRLEKIYAVERARAHQRVQEMMEKHDNEVADLLKKYNLKSVY